MQIVSVRFRQCGKLYDFDTGGIEINRGDRIVVETEMGLSIGTVITGPIEKDIPQEKEIKKVIRKATEEDMKNLEENEKLSEEARIFCNEKIKERGLPMKLICTETTLDRKRIIFYFTADRRIDFRELVRDLAGKFKTRIEMRQIGVRDSAKMLGGIGACGITEVCCRRFLVNFAPISIKMAKEQDVILNPGKISGLCGRLMCCLSYEYEGGTEKEEEISLTEYEDDELSHITGGETEG